VRGVFVFLCPENHMPEEVSPEELVRRALDEFLDRLIRIVLHAPSTPPDPPEVPVTAPTATAGPG
jgi:hypothetical protein